ncbi:hypothetical protein HPB52_003732 [Rhipicephalus sanguineus]|uniref:Uncharacterized protein n=1 Tax=Rhipicephalus sanguineus TaxID=34632 RepID=A0A9D4Q4F2_RHISA|nr:hypothetical protein HPB52_003732 [Rhipicephalus sanguineus]
MRRETLSCVELVSKDSILSSLFFSLIFEYALIGVPDNRQIDHNYPITRLNDEIRLQPDPIAGGEPRFLTDLNTGILFSDQPGDLSGHIIVALRTCQMNGLAFLKYVKHSLRFLTATTAKS